MGIYACGESVSRRNFSELVVLFSLKQEAPAYRGGGTFTAMHATAFCCRGCMEKWYHVPQEKYLTEEQITRIADFLIYWIKSKL